MALYVETTSFSNYISMILFSALASEIDTLAVNPRMMSWGESEHPYSSASSFFFWVAEGFIVPSSVSAAHKELYTYYERVTEVGSPMQTKTNLCVSARANASG